MTRSTHAHWFRVALAMFAVGWGANQFSPMLIVYRHDLGLGQGAIAGLFAIYAAALIPGLLVGGPASDRFGRRTVVLPFVALSPLATLILVAGHTSLPAIAAGRALAGLCSGIVFGAATAWVRDLSPDGSLSARRAALAISAGFGLGPVVAALLAQWASHPLVTPYLPHLAIGAVAAVILVPVPGTCPLRTGHAELRWPPAAIRTLRFWVTVAPAAPVVFGSMSLAIVVLPEEVTSARSLSAGFAGLITVLAFAAGIGVQPVARRLETRRTHLGLVTGLAAATAGAAVSIAAVDSFNRVLAGTGAVLLGLAYGLCLVSGLRQAEQLAGDLDRGAVVACYYVLAYLGFAAPYAVAGLNASLGQAGTFTALTGAAALLTAWMCVPALRGKRRVLPSANAAQPAEAAASPGELLADRGDQAVRAVGDVVRESGDGGEFGPQRGILDAAKVSLDVDPRGFRGGADRRGARRQVRDHVAVGGGQKFLRQPGQPHRRGHQVGGRTRRTGQCFRDRLGPGPLLLGVLLRQLVRLGHLPERGGVRLGELKRVHRQAISGGTDPAHHLRVVPRAVAVPGDHGDQRGGLRGMERGGGTTARSRGPRAKLADERCDCHVAHGREAIVVNVLPRGPLLSLAARVPEPDPGPRAWPGHSFRNAHDHGPGRPGPGRGQAGRTRS
jgi:MFS family permease